MKKFLLGALVLLVCNSSALAVRVSSLFQAEVAVPSQTEEFKQQAVTEGLLQVLIKLSGNPDIGNNPQIKSSLKKADYYVQEYGYSAPTTEASEYLLQVRYNAEDIKKLLNKADIAFWGENRPLLLAWITVTNFQRNTEIVGGETAGKEYTSVKRESKKFGIPLIMPMMDVGDMSQISVSDINQINLPILNEAAKRYAPDGLLIGKLNQTNKGIESQWSLILNDHQWSWEITGEKKDDVITAIMNQVTQKLAKNYIVNNKEAQEKWLKLEISNITQRDDLSQLLQFLKQVALVKQVDLSQISGDVVELSILIRGSLDAFQKNATIGQHLAIKSVDEAENKLVYNWVR